MRNLQLIMKAEFDVPYLQKMILKVVCDFGNVSINLNIGSTNLS